MKRWLFFSQGDSFRSFFCGAGCLSILAAELLLAAGPEASTTDSNQLAGKVAGALQAEAEGDFLTRQRLLVEAAEFGGAKWQAGQIFEDQHWLDIASSIQQGQQDEKLTLYERRRSSLSDSVANHFALANWCARQELFDQCRSHLNRVLAFDSDNVRARLALGYRRFNGQWMSPRELEELNEKAQFAARSMLEFGSQIQSIADGLASPQLDIRDAAENRLLALQAPEAVPCVEARFSNAGPEISAIVLNWLAKIDSVEASQAIARFALFHPIPAVRMQASQALKDRSLFDFVPDMLEMLESPVAMMLVPSVDRNGNLQGYRQAFAQEQIDKTEVFVLDRVFERDTIPSLPANSRNIDFANGMEAIARRSLQESALRQFAVGEAFRNQQDLERENARTIQQNGRVAEVLSMVTGQEFSGAPKPLWDWWDDYCETKYQEYKPQRYRRTFLTSRVPVYETPLSPPADRACECFVAGTLVVTKRGAKPIEQVVIGDTVLSRNIWTGELSWKPVLRATTRPAEATLAIRTDEDSFACTPGHLFWVSGRGWQKASELVDGDVLHAAETPSVVLSVTPGPRVETYNLQVADNATYFVGKQMVMTHDVTPRGSNHQTVPGEKLLLALSRPAK
ncbi:MAG: Hint domain-containing protein [bacterium]|nr:Hint domain-containing protein [bacterium]